MAQFYESIFVYNYFNEFLLNSNEFFLGIKLNKIWRKKENVNTFHKFYSVKIQKKTDSLKMKELFIFSGVKLLQKFEFQENSTEAIFKGTTIPSSDWCRYVWLNYSLRPFRCSHSRFHLSVRESHFSTIRWRIQFHANACNSHLHARLLGYI